MLPGAGHTPDCGPECVPGAAGLAELVMGGVCLFTFLRQMLTLFFSISLMNHLDCVYRDLCLCCCEPDLSFRKPIIFL